MCRTVTSVRPARTLLQRWDVCVAAEIYTIVHNACGSSGISCHTDNHYHSTSTTSRRACVRVCVCLACKPHMEFNCSHQLYCRALRPSALAREHVTDTYPHLHVPSPLSILRLQLLLSRVFVDALVLHVEW